MNSKRQGRRKLGHVVRIDVFQYPGVNVILNLSYVRWKSDFVTLSLRLECNHFRLSNFKEAIS